MIGIDFNLKIKKFNIKVEREDKISKMFIDNEHKLSESPPDMVWARLEKRLDARDIQTTSKTNWFRYASAAAVLVLAVCSYFVYQYSFSTLEQTMAEKKIDSTQSISTEHSEESKETASNDTVIYVTETKAKSTTQANKENIVIIEESPKIIESILSPKQDANSTISENIKETETEKLAPSKIQEEVSTKPLPTVPSNSMPRTNPITNTGSNTMPANSNTGFIEAKKNTEIVAGAEADDYFYENSSNSTLDINVPIQEKKEVDRIVRDRKELAKNTSKAKDKIASKPTTAPKKPSYDNNLSGVPADKADREDLALNDGFADAYKGISQFDWLVGTWIGDANNSYNTEIWSRTASGSLECTATRKLNDSNIFREKMGIMKRDGMIYLLLQIDDAHPNVEFRLRSNTGTQMIFEQNSIANIPNQVIFQRNSDRSYSMSLEYNNGKNMSIEQQTFLQNRNYVDASRSTRTMIRK